MPQNPEPFRPLAAEVHALLDSLSEGVLLVDRQGRIVAINPAALAFFRWTGDPPVRVSDLWLIEVTQPDGSATPAEARPTRRASRGETFTHSEYRLRRNDTGETWFGSFNGRPVAGAPEGGLGVLTFYDITQRMRAETALRESERRFRRLIENSTVGVALADLNGGVHYANQAVLDMFGYTAEDIASGLVNWMAITPAAYAGVDRRAVEEIRATGACRPFEKEYLAKDGRPVPALVSGIILEAESANPVVAAFLIDLSERKRLEERLRHAEKAESVGLLAAGVAHDFNNLLLGVMGNASLSLDALPPDSPVAAPLEAIIQSARQAAHLTRQMLAYAGKGRFIVEPADLSTVAQDACAAAAPSVPSRISRRFALAAGLPAVEADRAQLQQVITNLIINAAEAIGDEEGSITVRSGVRTLDEDAARHLPGWGIAPGPCVFLEVSDTGAGMDAATIYRIFDPFYTTKFTGRGLGLAAVAGIVRAHHGAVEVESAPGQGARFTVLLPATGKPAVEPFYAPAGRVSGSGAVLVVDDDAGARSLAQAALEARGFTAFAAASGAEALAVAARETTLSAAVIDMEMPGMSGAETFAALRQLLPQIRCLVVSGYSEDDMRQAFSSGGVSGFLPKPYTAGQLAAAVARTLEN